MSQKAPTVEKKVVYTYEDALAALQHYCAYQDRCHSDVRKKLKSLEFYGDLAEEVICALIQEKYLDEERFARSFARGKFRMKRWGRMKITRELRQRDVSPYCIKKGLAEIEEADYLRLIEDELERRNRLEKKGLHPYLRRRKLADYMFQRGYESNLTWEAINQLGL